MRASTHGAGRQALASGEGYAVKKALEIIWNNFSKAESTPSSTVYVFAVSQGSGVHASLRGRHAPHNGVGVGASIYKREPSETQVIHEVTRPEPAPSLIDRGSLPQKPAMAYWGQV